MTTEKAKKENKAKGKETKEITFRCRFRDRFKRFDEMVVITRFFPPLVVCQDCEKKMR